MMFHEFEDNWVWTKRSAKLMSGRERKRFVEEWLSEGPVAYFDKEAVRSSGIFGGDSFHDKASFLNVTCQQMWRKNGAPYFKIWPEMTHLLSKVDLGIAGKHLNLPYSSFALRMPIDEPHALTIPANLADGSEGRQIPMKSCLVTAVPRKVGAGGIPIKYRNWSDRKYTLQLEYHFEGWSTESVGTGFHNYVVEDGKRFPLQFTMTTPIFDDVTLEESCRRALVAGKADYQEGDPPDEFVERLLRLAVSVCFFGVNQHEFVMPDLPRKKIVKYRKIAGTPEGDDTLKKLRERAVKNSSGFGWALGSETHLPTTGSDIRYDSSEETGRQLKSSHMRRGHMRLQKYGKRTDPKYRMKFIKPTLVRPDLVLKESSGFTLKDEVADRRVGK